MELRNPTYTKDGMIDVEINHPIYGWIPFTATPDDPEEYGRSIFDTLNGDPSVAAYTPAPPDEDELMFALNVHYLAKLNGGTVWNAFPVATDEAALIKMNAELMAILTNTRNPQEKWRFEDGRLIELSNSSIHSLNAAIRAHRSRCESIEQLVASDIKSGKLIYFESIKNYDWPQSVLDSTSIGGI